MCVLDLEVWIKKQPSPETKPATHWPIFKFLIEYPAKENAGSSGLSAGLILGKANFNLSGKPLFKEALILTISCKPSKVRCFLSLMISKAFLNNKKSACFCVLSGYRLKCSRIRTKSFKLVIWNLADSPYIFTLPALKNFWIRYKISTSLLCKCILKTKVIFQPRWKKGFLRTFNEKQD